MPATLNIEAATNETLQFTVVWEQTIQGVTSLVNILSWNARMQVRAFLDSATPLIDVGTAGLGLSGITVNGVTSSVSVVIPYDTLNTVGAGTYVYDLVLIDPVSGYSYPVTSGSFTIQQGVTEPDYSVSTSGSSSGGTSSSGSLTPTGVTPGTYTLATVVVDAYGRIFGASNGTLANTGVTPGEYIIPNLTIGEDGRITQASNGTLGTTGVTAGTYTRGATLSIGADGRIDSATAGTCYEPGDNFLATDTSTLINATSKTLETPNWLTTGNISIEFGDSTSNSLSVVMNNGTTNETLMLLSAAGVQVPQIKQAVQLISSLAGTVTIDLAKYRTVVGTCQSGTNLVIEFINYTAGYQSNATLIITNGASAASITYGNGGNAIVQWPGGTPPTLSSGTDILDFMTADGDNWFGTGKQINFSIL